MARAKKNTSALPPVPPRAPAGHHAACACGLCTRARRARAPLPSRPTDATDTAPKASSPGSLGTCRVCGCDDEWGCEAGCSWAEPDLCSSCVRELDGKALDAALRVAADELVDALINAPDDGETDAVAHALEKVLAGFGIRRAGGAR